MKHKLISRQSNKILTYFNELGQDSFDYFDAEKAIPSSKESNLRSLLSDMVKRGLIMRLKKGVFYVIPYEREPKTYMPDWHLLAEPLTKGTNHYIGYYSAMQIHNLISQPSLKEQIVVDKQVKPSSLSIKDVQFQFIYHNKKHFFGANRVWADSFNKVWCSDLEKTMVDCLFKPNYAGGIVEVAKAIFIAKDKINFDKLLEYTEKFDSQAVTKRLGFILELLELDSNCIEKLKKLKRDSYVLLDTELPKTGKFISRWAIQQNMDTETILASIYT